MRFFMAKGYSVHLSLDVDLNTVQGALLASQRRKGFLEGDWGQKWVRYDNPKRRKSWGYPGHASTPTAKPNINDSKVTLSIWWDQLGAVYYELLKPTETITGDRYRTQLMRLSRALKDKRPQYNERHDKVILQHGNARPHAAKVVKTYLETLKWEVLPHRYNLLALHFKYDQARRRFVEWAQNEIAVVPDFHKRILLSDEAHFWLNGYVNKQNCRIWSETNPQVYVETQLHPEKLTVWCALWTGGIMGPYFFKNDEGHNVTVNGDPYRAMITNFFIPELNNHDVQELWFQQDGATCHTARATIDLLKDTFGDRLISRFGPVNWPPRSCDLTPLDYFLCGYVKSLVYADKPQRLDHLEDNICRVIAYIRP
ncbi:mariner Mos1 transposase [Trichonephila clavipes]|uniref:Mariner Mos1 transposase n=1 Tax=Trichonephila clavipes TaxID=2585209 RepID=A0A8X6R6I6_TRICX|nr:mariner Mos1 transposase [Trichonephila clavipes]